MKRIEFSRWLIPDRKGKLKPSSWDMDEETAQRQYPGCTRVPGTSNVREVPETEDEYTERLRGMSMAKH